MKVAIAQVNGVTRVVLDAAGEFIDLTAELNLRPEELPVFLGQGAAAVEHCRRILRSAARRIPLQAARLRAPVARPDKLIGIGLNYRSFIESAREIGMPIPTEKIWFLRPASCIRDPGETVWAPQEEEGLDYEVELAILIGSRCRHVSPEAAAGVIAGYCVANDLTLRERVRRSITLAKSFETHTPMGPWVVTPDELGDPQNLGLHAWVNGELRQNSSTAEMVTGCYQLVADLSAAFVLNPGDIILTGTPSGCGILHRPPKWLQAGDTVRVEIDGIGVLENQVIHEPA